MRSLFVKSDYVREPTDLNKLISDLARLLREEAILRGVSIQLRLDETLPHLRLDPVQIQQVLLNLVTNGMESMAAVEKPRVLEISSGLNDADTVFVSRKIMGLDSLIMIEREC